MTGCGCARDGSLIIIAHPSSTAPCREGVFPRDRAPNEGLMSEDTAYLDSANIFDLAEGRASTAQFKKILVNRGLVVVLSFQHLLEMAQRSARSRDVVASYLDQIARDHKVRWIRGLTAVERAEVRVALLRYLGLSPEPVDPFADNVVDVIESPLSASERQRVRTFSIRRLAREVSGNLQDGRYRSIKQGVPATRVDMRRRRGRSKRLNDSDIRRLIENRTPKKLITDSGIEYKVTPDDRTEFVRSLEISDCPAMAERLALLEGWLVSEGGEAPSDLEDRGHVVGAAYCTVAFADRRVVAALRTGRAPRLPQRNGNFLGWLARA